jgi:tetratricopeptide (TPR) repeat protein
MAKVGWCGIDWDKEAWTAEGREKIFIEMTKIIEERKLDKRMIATAYCNRGHVFGCRGDFEKAISDYSSSIELNPYGEVAYHLRADAYYITKDYKKALSDITNAIRLNSSEKKLKIDETKLLEKIKLKLAD